MRETTKKIAKAVKLIRINNILEVDITYFRFSYREWISFDIAMLSS